PIMLDSSFIQCSLCSSESLSGSLFFLTCSQEFLHDVAYAQTIKRLLVDLILDFADFGSIFAANFLNSFVDPSLNDRAQFILLGYSQCHYSSCAIHACRYMAKLIQSF